MDGHQEQLELVHADVHRLKLGDCGEVHRLGHALCGEDVELLERVVVEAEEADAIPGPDTGAAKALSAADENANFDRCSCHWSLSLASTLIALYSRSVPVVKRRDISPDRTRPAP